MGSNRPAATPSRLRRTPAGVPVVAYIADTHSQSDNPAPADEPATSVRRGAGNVLHPTPVRRQPQGQPGSRRGAQMGGRRRKSRSAGAGRRDVAHTGWSQSAAKSAALKAQRASVPPLAVNASTMVWPMPYSGGPATKRMLAL